MGSSAQSTSLKSRTDGIINVKKKPEKVSIRIREAIFLGLEKTEKARDAAGEFIGKFLAVGWPGFAAAFLYATMVPAVAGMVTVGGVAFLIGSLVTAALGLIANIGLLKYNQHKQDINDALDKEPLSDEAKVKQAKTQKTTQEQGVTYGVKQMIARMQSKINELKDQETVITRKTAHTGVTRAVAATRALADALTNTVQVTSVEQESESLSNNTRKILGNLQHNTAGKSTTIAVNKIEGEVVELELQNQLLLKHIQGEKGNGGLLAKEEKMAKSKRARFLAYAFQALATAVGMAGLPFFVFLSTNALVITFLTNPIAISVVVAASALWGIVCGISFLRDTYKDYKAHNANVDQLKAAVTELSDKQSELVQTKRSLLTFASDIQNFVGITIDRSPAKVRLERAMGDTINQNERGGFIFRPDPKPSAVPLVTDENQLPAVAVGGRVPGM